jgi:hypothetical protein
MKKLVIADHRATPAALTAAELAAIDGGDRRDRPRPEEPPPPPKHDKPKWQPRPQYGP